MKFLSLAEQFLFYFLFFAIPLQVRKILYYPGWYYNEWQAISFYLTDLILIILFLFWGWRVFQTWRISNFKFLRRPGFARVPLREISKQFKNPKFQFSNPDFYLILFLIAAGVSVKNSSNLWVGLFLWLKLAEFSLFYFYLKHYASRKFNFITVLYVLLLGGLFQAVIAIGQFLKQGSLGLTSLGESVIGPNMAGIASFFVASGEKVIRAYGTTPHPNILAAYLFLSIFALYFLYIRINHPKNFIYTYILIYGYIVVLFGLFFTFSRTMIFLWAVGFLAMISLPIVANITRTMIHHRIILMYGDIKVWRKKLVSLFLVTLSVVGAFSLLYWPEVSARLTLSSEEEAVQLRVFYNEESLKGGINLFGIGLGDFIGWLMEQNPNLPGYVYQPVHNIYLLVYKEIGIIGFVLFLLFIGGLLYEFVRRARMRKMWNYSFLLVTGSVLFMGLFDHFLLTIQQGRFIFWPSLALLGALAPSLNKHPSENDSK